MKKEESFKKSLFSRRAFIFAAFKLTLFGMIAGRMAYLQLFKSKDYKMLAEGNRVRVMLMPSKRGDILDRVGQKIAYDISRFRAEYYVENKKDIAKIAQTIPDLLNLDGDIKNLIRKKILKASVNQQILLYDNLSWEDVVRLEMVSSDFQGLIISKGQSRYYEQPFLFSHVTGYVGSISEKDLTEFQVFNHPDFKVGKIGVEKMMENNLRGLPSIKKVEVNAHGKLIRNLDIEIGKSGSSFRSSISKKLQEYSASILSSRGASGIAMNIKTGEILSLVSLPGYDVNTFTSGYLPRKFWNDLAKNPDLPLINRAISSLYPPGSIFKLVTCLAALETGVDASTSFHCPGYMMLGNHVFQCWRHQGHGTLSMMNGIQNSCNVYMYNLAKKIGIEPMAEVARKLGLGEVTGIELTGEKAGFVPDKKLVKKRYNHTWTMGDNFNSAIGQGFNLATPIQMLCMAARIATGREIKPTFNYQSTEVLHPLVSLNNENLEIIRNAMFNVVNIPGGTAYGSRIVHDDFLMCGKTATSQVISKKKNKEDLSSSSTAWENRNHGMFVCFAPAKDPKYAVFVINEHSGSGSGGAAPFARDIMLKIRELEAVGEI